VGQRAQLVVGEVAAELLLAGPAGMVVAQHLAYKTSIQPARGRDDHQHIAGPGAHRQRLEHLAGIDADSMVTAGAPQFAQMTTQVVMQL
jgi:hypothetical protein